jgi:hypothetical protein
MVAGVPDIRTPHDTSSEHYLRCPKLTVSSNNCKYNEQDKNKHMKTASLNRYIDMMTNKSRLNPDNIVNNEANINYRIPVCIDLIP